MNETAPDDSASTGERLTGPSRGGEGRDGGMREIALHVLDICQNSIEAGATRVSVTVDEDTARDSLAVVVADNGRGMPPELAGKAVDPFVTTRTTRKVGLGLALLAATARQSGGSLTVASAEGEGTTVTAVFGLRNIDRPPLGDMPVTLSCLLAANPDLELVYRHRRDGREFVFEAGSFREELDGGSFSNPAVFVALRDHLAAGIRRVGGSEGTASARSSEGPDPGDREGEHGQDA